jgi:hypothetical protein
MSRASAGAFSLLVCALIPGLVSGCILDPKAGHRPARFHVGPNTRAMTVPAEPDATPTRTGTARSTVPTDPDPQQLGATSVSLQFTMAMPRLFYSGIEAETGRLDLPGSNLAAAYGVVGMEQDVGLGSFGAELAAGWQGVRYVSGEEDHDSLVVEPRLRAQLWIAEQWTLGATLGARYAGDITNDWMAGAYLGVHSHRF